MKERYIELMETVVSAYTDAHIREYVDQVVKDGLSEHGFPRLTSDIGVLLSHGRRMDLKDIFEQMMDICCEQIPTALATHPSVGNEFTVKEIVPCLLALEESGVFPVEKTQYWRKLLGTINPYTCYKVIAKNPPERIGNWAAFGGVSEQVRKAAGIGCEDEFIDNQIASQLLSFDENGMYRDPHEPMVYDITTRLQLSIAMHFGYDGAHKQALDDFLIKGGKQTLLMQSVTGEIPFGGRSNQFLHNEAVFSAVCEFEASRYQKLGDHKLAGQFKDAANLAVDSIGEYLSSEQLYHIKNCYPNDSRYGCERYAYFNKYMVTCASFLYVAYLFADDTIKPFPCPAREGNHIYRTSDFFHKTICKFEDYFVEYETDAYFLYDSNGLGRIHRKGAPSAICLTLPFTNTPNYVVDVENPTPLSICGGIYEGDSRVLACEEGTQYTLLSQELTEEHAQLVWQCKLNNGAVITETCTVTSAGVHLSFAGDGQIFCMLPAFESDGKTGTEITLCSNKLTINYRGWQCTYTVSGALSDTGNIYANRSGHYRAYIAEAVDSLEVMVMLEKAEI